MRETAILAFLQSRVTGSPSKHNNARRRAHHDSLVRTSGSVLSKPQSARNSTAGKLDGVTLAFEQGYEHIAMITL